MVAGKKKHFSVLHNYLFSYFLVFLIPFLILGFFMYIGAVHTLRNEVELANRHKLQQARILLDKQIKSLNQTAVIMANDNRLSPHMAKSNDYSASEAVRELARYRMGSPMLEELFLYFRGDDKIFSTSGVVSLEVLTGRIYRFSSGEDERSFREDLSQGQAIKLKPASAVTIGEGVEKRLLTYLYPLPSGGWPAYGTVLFLIDEAILTEMMKSVLGGFQGDVYLLNEQGEVLASERKGQSPEYGQLQPYLHEEKNGSAYTIRLNAQDYSVMSEKSEITGLSYLITMPTDQYWPRVIAFKQLVLLLLSLVLLLGLCSVVALSFRSSRPIRSLVRQLQGQFAPGRVTSSKKPNELEWIRHTFDDMRHYTTRLEGELEIQRPLVEEQAIYHLLKGTGGGEGSDVSVHPHLQPLRGLFYFVLVFSLENDRSGSVELKKRESILDMIRRFDLDGGKGGGLELIDEKAVAVLISVQLPIQDLRGFQEQTAEIVQQGLTERVDLCPQIAIGSIYKDMGMINRSFIEAMAALDYRHRPRTGKFIFFDDIAHLEDKTLWYSFGEQARFNQSLKQGDCTVCLETLDEMLDGIAEKEQSILLLRCMCFDMVNTVLKQMREMKIGDDWPEKKQMMEFQTLDDLRQRMGAVIRRICGHINSQNETRHAELCQRMLQFIDMQYQSSQMSLDFLSREFGLSVSYISRFLHEQTGMTFTEYVFRLRVKMVKHELVNTGKPLKDIIFQVGYYDVSNFIKKFRKQEGITPGDYRKQYGGLPGGEARDQ
ncbi:MAG: AraC family transcriptional regulator [Paenibacillaceae bacterium]|jgi:AraC-like DNA-binding protein|nr:AraC family transcriptional regulator [Paenibacillaceae bacterium]